MWPLLTRRQSGYDDTADALIETSEEDTLVDGIGGFVKIKAIVVGRLETRLESIERVHQQIYRESSEGAGLYALQQD